MEEVTRLSEETYVEIEDDTVTLSQDNNYIHLDPAALEKLLEWVQSLNWCKAFYPPIDICAMCKQPLPKQGKQP